MKLNRRTLIRLGIVTPFGMGAGLAGYTFGFEPHWLQFPVRELPIWKLPKRLSGATLAHVSDLHVGPIVDDQYIEYAFRALSKISPDIIVFTGDFVSHQEQAQIDQFARIAKLLPTGRIATVASLGNHDYGPVWSDDSVADQIMEILEGNGVQVLVNEVCDADGLRIVGMGDLWADKFDPQTALSGIGKEAAIVLSHNPDTLDQPGWGDYTGWVLAGHTHGGQVKPPFLPPPILPVVNKRYTSGTISLPEGRAVFISKGVGYLKRVRFSVRPEIPIFRLKASTRPNASARQ